MPIDVTAAPRIQAEELALARVGIERNSEVRDQPEFITEQQQNPQARLIYMFQGKTVVDPASATMVSIPYPGAAQVPELYLGNVTHHQSVTGKSEPGPTFLRVAGSLEELPSQYRQIWEKSGEPHADSAQFMGLRAAAAILNPEHAALLSEAQAGAHWLVSFGFCPRCGSETTLSASGWVRTCTVEGVDLFPRSDPAIIVAIVSDQDRILLANNTLWPPTRHSVLAGYVEPGESAESAVAREVFEESGATVDQITYLGSQAWPFPASLMLGFMAHASSEEVQPDGVEIRSLRWFSRSELTEALAHAQLSIPPRISIARILLERWYGGDIEVPEESTRSENKGPTS